MEYPCGLCTTCRWNRCRLWTSRLVLESRLHDFSWFVTLTYDDFHHPVDGSCSVRELQLFMKRLRESVDEKLRYYAVGEYGDVTGRAHYHLCLFGLSDPLHVNPSDLVLNGLHSCTCVLCRAWQFKGGVDVGEFSAKAAAYVAGYVTKKAERGFVRADGRAPEFSRMSLRPGIGFGAVCILSKTLSTKAGALSVAASGDVPTVVRFEGARWPLGRYLRGKLRVELGVSDGKEPGGAALARGREMQDVLLQAGERDRREQKRIQVGRRSKSLMGISNSKKGFGL